MNRIKTIFTLFLIVLSLALFAENEKTVKRSLQWKGVQYRQGIVKGDLVFDNALYGKVFNGLPHCAEMVAIAHDEKIASVKIIATTFLPLTDEEKSCVDEKLLSDTLQYKISYATQKLSRYAIINLLPLSLKNGTIQKLINYTIVMDVVSDASITNKVSRPVKANSVLNTGSWFKIKVEESGVYKVTYSDLKSWGVDVSNINVSNIGIFGNGGALLPEITDVPRNIDLVQNPIDLHLGGDGVFNDGDYFLFYGDDPVFWDYKLSHLKYYHHPNYYSHYTYYFFTPDQGGAKELANAELSEHSATEVVTEYDALKYYNVNDINLVESGREWYGKKMDAAISTVTIPDFTFENVVEGSQLYLMSNVAGKSGYISKMKAYANGEEVYSHSIAKIDAGERYAVARKSERRSKFDESGDTYSVKFEYEAPTSTSMAWLNWVELQARCELRFTGNDLDFRDWQSVAEESVVEYHIADADNAAIWEITDVVNAKVVNATVSGGKKIFKADADSLRRFIAFNTYKSAEFVERVANQNLHAIKNIDYLIISHSNFIDEAERLGEFHMLHDGLSYKVVDIQKVYNEFGSGAPDVTAMRDFARHIYLSSSDGKRLRYLLFFGDASYDLFSDSDKNTNYVPTFESYMSLSISKSYCSDDYFALLDDGEGHKGAVSDDFEGLLDIGTGRFPAKTPKEAALLVDKVIGYANSELSMGEWRNQICLIGDDEDSNQHFQQAEDLAKIVDTGYVNYNLQKIYLDAFKQEITPGGSLYPEVNEAVTQQMFRGALVMNYTGHGGNTGLAEERVLTIPEIENWSNVNALPLFITATCEFSPFDKPDIISAGERILLHDNGGGIALFTTTRIAFSNYNHALNMRIYRELFKEKDGEYQRLGDFMIYAKSPNAPELYNFVLLGDPALKLAYTNPDYDVVTTKINGEDIETFSDTLKALSKVTISGEVRESNRLLNNFNGTIVPIVYDKKYTTSTLGNDSGSFPEEFELQNSLLYKGKASVENGLFSFSFIVPKDIDYSYGFGKISYYAHNEFTDAAGSYSDIVIGGSSSDMGSDDEGPEITVFMNDRNFVEGEIVNDNPLLIADIFDESGINTVGSGIGHDIVAYLDGNTSKSISLNEYYSAELDSYKKGTVLYIYTDLEDGLHTLTVKAWDVYNNSSEKTIEFEVSGNIKPEITELKNYPNPFDNETTIKIVHNQFNEKLKTDVRIFSFDGRLIKQIGPTDIQANGYFLPEIHWDGTDGNGNRTQKGFYIYNVILTNTKGVVTSQGGKMVKLF
ncbi:MAG: type IX secretion system sortase PorU [Bacteroidota bacterium]|nr:type IX secretion system sortase PorU [Bacteroidota bacterium]